MQGYGCDLILLREEVRAPSVFAVSLQAQAATMSLSAITTKKSSTPYGAGPYFDATREPKKRGTKLGSFFRTLCPAAPPFEDRHGESCPSKR